MYMPSVYSILNYLHEILSVNKGKRKEKKKSTKDQDRENLPFQLGHVLRPMPVTKCVSLSQE